MRGFVCSLLIAGGCGFEARVAAGDGPPEGIDSPDASPLQPYWIVAGMSRGSMPLVRIFPFDGTSFTTPCTEQPSTTSSSFAIRDLINHPTLPLVYGVDAGFRSLSLNCSAMTFAGMSMVGGPRPIQQIARDPMTGIGFFTADGSLAIGVYRFTSGANGDPTVTGMDNAPSAAGPIALDAANAQLYVAGPAIIGGYALSAGLDFNGAYVSAAMCQEPVRILTTGNDYLLAFCGDETEIRRYTRNPFLTDPTLPQVGALGPVDQVVALPGDRAVAARKAPQSDLVVVSNNGGLPSWGVGPPVASRILAMGASIDGRVIATARVTGPASSEIGLWRVDSNTITLMDVIAVDTVVTALTVSTPGT